MTLLPPTYDIGKSYEENYRAGPVYAGAIPPMPAARKTWSFLGFDLASPIGVPAGPLLNAAYVELYARLGWDVPVYKTVRSVARASVVLDVHGDLRAADQAALGIADLHGHQLVARAGPVELLAQRAGGHCGPGRGGAARNLSSVHENGGGRGL